jgi:dipeptidyl-peptidase-4
MTGMSATNLGPVTVVDAVSFPRLRARTRNFTLGHPRTIEVCADGARVLFLRSAAGDDARTGLFVLDLPDGEERAVIAPADDAELSAAERSRRERVRETASGVVSYAADDAGRIVAVVLAGALHAVDVDAGTVDSLDVPGVVFDPRPDPTGRHIAYASDRQLRVVAVDGSNDRMLAGEESETVSWGRAEFVASEEMSRYRGYWWAPDGTSMLVARVDEAPVAQWWISDPTHPDQPPTATRYPAAGTADADVTLWLITLDGERREIQWDRNQFPYLGRVTWSAGGPPLLAVVTADQHTVRYASVDVSDCSTTVLADDTDDAWTELFDGVPAWYDGELVRIVDRDGSRSLVVGDSAVTPAGCYVRSVEGVSSNGIIVATTGDDDPTRTELHHWSRAGLVAVGERSGEETAVVGGTTVVVTSTRLEDVARQTTVRADGAAPRPLGSVAAEPPFVPQVRMLVLGERRLRAGLIMPRDHTPGQRLPVLMDPYGGPHFQRVTATARGWLESQWFADQGFAVLTIDGRGTPGRSPAWEREVYLDLATSVLEDQVDGLLAAAVIEPDLDLSRVGIRGWSFGGFLAALAVLRRPDVFHAAVSGAPVTDMTLYDTYYTERYLGTPQEHPEAYRASNLLEDAALLTRPLMLIHGLADDNVASAHTLQLSQRLLEAGRPHQVLPLTGITHMPSEEAVAENLLLLQVEFLHRNLPTG